MTDEEKYSIISVNTDEEDEIVIQAGFVQEPPDNVVSEEVFSVEETELDQAHTETFVSDEKGAYQATTLEDLQTAGPSPKTRIVVLVCAALLVVGFVVYYLFIRPIITLN